MMRLNIRASRAVGFVAVAAAALFGTSTATNAATLSVLHAFTGLDGAQPQGQLFYSSIAGNAVVAGTAQNGGANFNGAAFSYNLQTGAVADLYSFLGAPDGANPTGGVATDLNANDKTNFGSFYGVTQTGGTLNDGVIWKISTSGAYSVVYSFGQVSNPNNPFSPLDGFQPQSTLAQAADGKFYGTTLNGGAGGGGTLFRLDPATNAVTTLYSFGANPASNDGTNPFDGLTVGKDKNLYGVTSGGGTFGSGSVYRFSPTTSAFTTIYSFTGVNDGANPQCVLALDPNGYLYGTTPFGGAHGAGTVFRLTTSGVFTTLYAFSASGVTDGSAPLAGVSVGPDGLLYGTTTTGGANSDPFLAPNGAGVVYSINVPGKSYKKLHDFVPATEGASPDSNLLVFPHADGTFSLFGTTQYAGPQGNGSFYLVTP